MTFTESAQAFCRGTHCQCNNCVQLNCHDLDHLHGTMLPVPLFYLYYPGRE